MKSHVDQPPTRADKSPRDRISDQVLAARRAVVTAETELDRALSAIAVSPRVQKQLVSAAVATALATLHAALRNLEAATELLAVSPDEDN